MGWQKAGLGAKSTCHPPLHQTNCIPGHGFGGPGTAALSRPSWRRGNFHRCWPISTPLSPAREYTSSAPAYMLPPLGKMFCSGISVQPATFSSPVSHGRPVTCLLTCSDACGEAGMFSSSAMTPADVCVCQCRIFIGNKRYMEFCNN